ncbi:MAG: membrane lipoprotein lipid attachment site-containing protein [Sedimentisphaerales bacterium]|nr:membrane lipoprotein lipid attachment site-containing protein [Sedimentisphaerales bacterium]
MKRIFLIITISFLLTGCAGVEVTKITPGNDKSAKGIRYYRPWPYLLVAQDVNDPSSLQLKTVYLPNIKENYAVNAKSGIGALDAAITLEDGWKLTQYADKTDTKIPETIQAIGSISADTINAILEVITKRNGSEKEPIPLTPGLYRFEFDDEGAVINFIYVPFVVKEQ